MSSVSGLKVTPRTPIVLPPTSPPSAALIRSAIASLRASFTAMVVSTSRIGEPASRAVRASASVSLGKQDPP